MPNTREKLIELLGYETCKDKQCIGCEHYSNETGCIDYLKAEIADHLIANGVTILTEPECEKINIKLPKEIVVHPYKPKWIPVTERLPDTAERVLVSKHWLGMQYKPDYGYYQDFPNQKGCWYVLTEFGYYPQREITHWMPLPEPPKGE